MGTNLKSSYLYGMVSSTKVPTKSPTIFCKYKNSDLYNADIKCIWETKCVLINCGNFITKPTCKATNGKCKWKSGICSST